MDNLRWIQASQPPPTCSFRHELMSYSPLLERDPCLHSPICFFLLEWNKSPQKLLVNREVVESIQVSSLVPLSNFDFPRDIYFRNWWGYSIFCNLGMLCVHIAAIGCFSLSDWRKPTCGWADARRGGLCPVLISYLNLPYSTECLLKHARIWVAYLNESDCKHVRGNF